MPDFLRDAAKLFDEQERADLITYLALNPEAGTLVKGTGGFRKLRWARQGMGKRGGARVIYIYFQEGMPLFLLRAYAKNVREDLSSAEKKALKAFAEGLKRKEGAHA